MRHAGESYGPPPRANICSLRRVRVSKGLKALPSSRSFDYPLILFHRHFVRHLYCAKERIFQVAILVRNKLLIFTRHVPFAYMYKVHLIIQLHSIRKGFDLMRLSTLVMDILSLSLSLSFPTDSVYCGESFVGYFALLCTTLGKNRGVRGR